MKDLLYNFREDAAIVQQKAMRNELHSGKVT